MRSLLVISIVLCLGLATAAPATDLIRALLKRAEAEAKPQEGGEEWKEIIPSENEFKALGYLGGSIEWLVEMAADPEAFIAYMDAEIAKSQGDVAAEKRSRGGRKGPGGKGPGGKGPMGGKDSSEESGEVKPKGQKDWEADFERSIMEIGVYKTVLKHVGMMGKMLKHSHAIFTHMTEGKELPEEVEGILLGEASEEETEQRRQVEVVSESEQEDSKSNEKPERPEGGKMGGKGGPRGGNKGPKPPKSASAEVDAASELAKRLLSLLSRRK